MGGDYTKLDFSVERFDTSVLNFREPQNRSHKRHLRVILPRPGP